MDKDKMFLINKLFKNKQIRTVWNSDEEKYYISIVDVIESLTESVRPRKYWSDLKKKLNEEGHNELSEKIGQLKLKSSDGKYYLTDVCDIEEIFRIIESVPSKNAEPIKRWLAKLGSERIDEVFDPSIAVERSIDLYRAKGYDEKWINERIKGIQSRKSLTDVWNDGGITKEVEYAILTNDIYKEWSGMTAKEYKEYKGLRKESLRDNMTDLEVAISSIGELAAREIAKNEKPIGLKENRQKAKRGGMVAKKTKDFFEEETGSKIISKENALDYQYIDNKKEIG